MNEREPTAAPYRGEVSGARLTKLPVYPAESERRPLAASFDKLVEVNLQLTGEVRRLVRGVWIFLVVTTALEFTNLLLHR